MRKKILGLGLVVFLTLLFRAFPILLGSGQQADMILYGEQAAPLFEHLNVYQVTYHVFPYTPLAMPIPALCMALSTLSSVAFHIVMKIPALIGDLGIAATIFVVLGRYGGKAALFWGVLYAVNPVSILITSFHGNMMALPTLLMFLAYVVLLRDQEKNYRLSGLLLGLAVGLRTYPVLLVPLFFSKMTVCAEKKKAFLAYCLVPACLSAVPFLVADFPSFLRETCSYAGTPDFGLMAVGRAVKCLHQMAFFRSQVEDQEMIVFKNLFFIYYGVILYYCGKRTLIASIMLTFLGFYFISAGVAAQYFIWILPFAFLAKQRFLYMYLVFASLAMVDFYALYHPRILFDSRGTVPWSQHDMIVAEIVCNFLLWSSCGIWIGRLLREKRGGSCLL